MIQEKKIVNAYHHSGSNGTAVSDFFEVSIAQPVVQTVGIYQAKIQNGRGNSKLNEEMTRKIQQ